DRVLRFLQDLDLCCNEISKILKIDGRAVFVVARRSVGGWRLKLDIFLIEAFKKRQISLERISKRWIQGKRNSTVVNRYGRARATAKRSDRGRVPTMREEFVLVFRKGEKTISG